MCLLSQGVEGIRGRQGLEGPKGDTVSSSFQIKSWIVPLNIIFFQFLKKNKKTLIFNREK